MPGYAHEALHRFQQPVPSHNQDKPRSWTHTTYVAKVHYSDYNNSSPQLEAKTVTLVQSVVGNLLYYAITIEPEILTTIGYIDANNSKSTFKTYDANI